ncbi:FadR/GntR family transcriptional regulator [Nitriliruptor alkaliphilus]|uniref:FadR/GntR family transcriptional regulator n=1 Tax=Nitriliruptor alkaliphilus TaxID=427918 RepID=UPI000698095B|nr:FCD domain-containing protein [Nitriliruptor alkaliphilus]
MSRTTIREALKLLQEKRLIRVRQGLGTTVLPEDEWDLLDPVVLAATVRNDGELGVLDQLVDVRRALEGQMAQQTALRATPADLGPIRDAFEQLVEEVHTPEVFVQSDVRFHEAIMFASGNRLARAIVRTVHGEALRSVRYTGAPTTESCAAANEGHRQVLDCLEAGDGEGAATAMSDHILDGWLRRRPTRTPHPDHASTAS